ncbi:MAG TPA: AAA family ATPase [Dehalococcoidia bacterium]|nr:AAA family ATPase [Dehalococcoidia bacterium]
MVLDGLRCELCGQMNPPDARFCNSCGSSLEAKCPDCGRLNPPGSAFCNNCGRRLRPAPAQAAIETPRHLAERILRDRAGLEGERRNVTVLFIDAADSTATGSRVDMEVLHAVVRECTQRMADAVHRYEGTVTQFRGDGIMAIFGAPIAHEDSARRAVAAALAMRDSLVAFSTELQAAGRPHFRYRIGLNSGPVVVGRIGDDLSMDYTAIGDTVNLAARMEAAARNDSIYITDAVYRQVREYFEFRPLGQLEVKGKAEPVEAYEVLRALPVRDRLEAIAARGLSPFVGRERELAALRGYFEQARRGQGHVVFISGEAGMGKSRLLLEFRRSLGEDGATWVEAHCNAYARNTPYVAITEVLKSAFALDEADTEDVVVGRVQAAVAEWDEAAQPTAAYLRFLLNVDPGDAALASMDAGARRAGVLDSLRALLLQLSRRRPVVLVVEDLHWIDAQSQDALAGLIDVSASAPVLMLLTFRPGYSQPFGDRSYFSRIALSNLGAEESALISESLIEGAALPEEVRRLIFSKAEGNPFYVEEVTKSLVESGALRRSNGTLAPARPLSQIQIPDTIQGVILSRIDRLDRRAREAIQLASVIGREFTVRLLQRISDVEAQLEGLLGELKGLELIYEKAFFPELSYMFKHALTHDVAYSTLLVERRRALHRVVAQAIEDLYSERLAEHYEMLAHHFYEAQDWDKALDYLTKAARKALDTYAHAEATSFLERAMEAVERASTPERDQVRADLQAYRGRALIQAAAWPRARPDLESALAALSPERLERRLEVLGDLAMACWWSRDTPAMRRYAGDLRALASEMGREDLVTVADAWLAAALSAEGDPLRSLSELTAIAERARKLRVTMPPGPGSFVPLWNYWTGRLDEAVRVGREAVERARRENHVLMLMEALPHFAVSLAAHGDYAEALEVYREARQVGERYGAKAPLSRAIAMEAGMHLDLLDFEGAATLQQEAREVAAAAGFPPAAVSAGIDLLLNLARQGRPAEAEAIEPEIAAAVEREAGWHGWLWRLRLAQARAELALVRGDWQQAVRQADEAIERSLATGRVKYQVAALGVRGAARSALGNREDAVTDLRRAIDLARGTRDPAMLLRAMLALLVVQQDEAALTEAREVADRIAAALPGGLQGRFIAAAPLRLIRRST